MKDSTRAAPGDSLQGDQPALKSTASVLANCVALVICLNGLAVVPAYAAAALPPDDRCWRLVAASDVIVHGTIVRGAEARDRDAPSGWAYDEFVVQVGRVLKGGATERASSIRFRYSERADHDVRTEKPKALIGKDVLVFLVEGFQGADNLYLSRTSRLSECRALTPAERNLVESVAREVAEQAVLVDSPSRDCTRDSAGVRALIAGLRRSGSQDESIEGLMKLGPEEVPALITHIGDGTPLAKRSMQVPRPASHFEAASFHSPQTVTDVLATVLEHITGESFGALTNGGSDTVRKRVKRGWKVYLEKLCAGVG